MAYPGASGADLRFSSGQVPACTRPCGSCGSNATRCPRSTGHFLSIAAEQALRHPLRYLVGSLYRPGFLWSGYPTEYLGGSFDRPLRDNVRAGGIGVAAIKLVCRLGFGVVLVAATVWESLLLLQSGQPLAVVPVAMLTYLTALTAFLDVPALRFRLPFEPLAIMLAMPVVWWVGRWWTRRPQRAPSQDA